MALVSETTSPDLPVDPYSIRKLKTATRVPRAVSRDVELALALFFVLIFYSLSLLILEIEPRWVL